MKQFTTKHLVEFGNYLLSAERGVRINSESNPNADKVHDADIANWKDSLPTLELTRGQQVMSVSFNPGQREDVAAIKQIFADAFDEIETWVRTKLTSDDLLDNPSKKDVVNDINRLAAISKTNLETAQMYVVKAVTR